MSAARPNSSTDDFYDDYDGYSDDFSDDEDPIPTPNKSPEKSKSPPFRVGYVTNVLSTPELSESPPATVGYVTHVQSSPEKSETSSAKVGYVTHAQSTPEESESSSAIMGYMTHFQSAPEKAESPPARVGYGQSTPEKSKSPPARVGYVTHVQSSPETPKSPPAKVGHVTHVESTPAKSESPLAKVGYGVHIQSFPEKSKAPPLKARGRGRGRGRGKGRGHGRHSQAKSDSHVDVVTKRLLSANELRVKELESQVQDMKTQMKVVSDENRLFKRMQHKQEKALMKFEDRESELPQMIQAHNNEVRSLREQLRHAREKYDKTDRYLRDAEDELDRANAKMKKYKTLSEQKNLGERSDLDRRLNKAETSLEEKNSRMTELERHLEKVKKNHRHEMAFEKSRAKEMQQQIEEIKEEKVKLETLVKEKEKMLEAKNIYSNRFLKPNSYNGTPAHSPPPWRLNLNKKSGSLTDLSSRDKAKAYEDKRKAEVSKKLQLPKLPTTPHRVLEKPPKKDGPKQKWVEEDKEENRTLQNTSTKREDSEAEFWRRQEQRYKQDQFNREKQDEEQLKREEEEAKEEARLRGQQEKMRRDLEERARTDRERREAEERERRERERKEEMERREKLDREREEREREERERREAEQQAREKREQEIRAREEQERIETESRLAEERRKKEELLHRLENMDTGGDGSKSSSDPFAPSAHTRTRGGDHFATSPTRRVARADTGDTHNNRKDYTFTRSVENLHQGKPSHDDVSVPYVDRQKRLKTTGEDEDIGGYQPSFSGPVKTMGVKQKKPLSLFDNAEVKSASKPAAAGPEKKSKLMAELFGSPAATDTKKNDYDDPFLSSKPQARQPAQSKRATGFPWEDSTPSTKLNRTEKRESSALFGGGAAVVDDDESGRHTGATSTLLPRRPRQAATTFSSKPAVLAVDNLDDDIEEVVL